MNDHWTTYEQQGNNGNGKGGGKPVVPEPANVGAILFVLAFLIVLLFRIKNKK